MILLSRFAYCVCFGIAIESGGLSEDYERQKSLSMRNMDSIEKCAAARIVARVSDQVLDAAIEFQFRGRSIWITGNRLVGKTHKERKVQDELLREIAKACGTDGRFFHAFDGKKHFHFDGLGDLEIKKANSLVVEGPMLALRPSSWIYFHGYDIPPLQFRGMLDGSAMGIVYEKLGESIRVIDRPNASAYKERWVELDASKDFLVSRYDVSGGELGHMEGVLDWRKMGDYWYAAKGEYKSNGYLVAAWEITEISFDASIVRPSFIPEESKLAFGTRVRDKSVDPQKEAVRYIGGKDGLKEYFLRKAAAEHIRLKKEK